MAEVIRAVVPQEHLPLVNSVGRAYGILRNRQTGDKREAAQFLQSKPKKALAQQNRSEGRNKHQSMGLRYKLGRKKR